MSTSSQPSVHERWAQLRFAVVGPLLASPPPQGQLRAELERLAERTWKHPVSGQPVQFAVSTIERWFLAARNARHDPVRALRRKRRTDAGRQDSLNAAARRVLVAQYQAHPGWSVQLHYDNLLSLAEGQPELRAVPSYWTVRRFLQAHGLRRRRRPGGARNTAGARRAEARLAAREVRSYEAEYVGGLWHWDYHHGSRKVVTAQGEWVTPVLFGVLDDRSRLACHLQWYLDENAEHTAHALAQAIQKRGLPRAGMSDNGTPMTAGEIVEGLTRLGIVHETTLPYSPYQNGKQEAFWAQIEGRLLAMLEDVEDLSLALLNEATQAWVELEYNRKRHAEIAQTPATRWLAGPQVLRPAPDSAALPLAFTRAERRTLRRSDATVSIAGRRFEVPNRYRHLSLIPVRYAVWDLTTVHLVDDATGTVLCRLYPQDKAANASGLRRTLTPIGDAPQATAAVGGMAPLLRKLIAERAASGLPPAYLPKDEGDNR